jgi:hypothetical protein
LIAQTPGGIEKRSDLGSIELPMNWLRNASSEIRPSTSLTYVHLLSSFTLQSNWNRVPFAGPCRVVDVGIDQESVKA